MSLLKPAPYVIMAIGGLLFVIVSLVLPTVMIGKKGVDGIGWFVLGMRDYIAAHQTQVFVAGWMFIAIAAVSYVAISMWSKLPEND